MHEDRCLARAITLVLAVFTYALLAGCGSGGSGSVDSGGLSNPTVGQPSYSVLAGTPTLPCPTETAPS